MITHVENFINVTDSMFDVVADVDIDAIFFTKDGQEGTGILSEMLERQGLSQLDIPHAVHERLKKVDTKKVSPFALLNLVMDCYYRAIQRTIAESVLEANPNMDQQQLLELIQEQALAFMEPADLTPEEKPVIEACLDKVRHVERHIQNLSAYYLRDSLDDALDSFSIANTEAEHRAVRVIASTIIIERLHTARLLHKLKNPDFAIIDTQKSLQPVLEDESKASITPGIKTQPFVHPQYRFEERLKIQKALKRVGLAEVGAQVMERYEGQICTAVRDYIHDLYIFNRDFYAYRHTLKILCDMMNIESPEIWYSNAAGAAA